MITAFSSSGEITRRCAGCGETLPLSSYSLNQHGNPRAHCRPGRSDLEKARYPVRIASRPAWQRAHAERQRREREARDIRRVYSAAKRIAEAAPIPPESLSPSQQTPHHKRCSRCAQTLPLLQFRLAANAKPESRCKPCKVEAVRECKQRKRWAPGSSALIQRDDPEIRRQLAERVDHLAALLMGTAASERINSQERWESVTDELQNLWSRSDRRVCVGCAQSVPPQQMRPPGPANFYSGKCNACARAEREESVRRTYGPLIGPLRGPRRIPMRDGTTITVAELARRHRERNV